jgi:hypothetical protein
MPRTHTPTAQESDAIRYFRKDHDMTDLHRRKNEYFREWAKEPDAVQALQYTATTIINAKS